MPDFLPLFPHRHSRSFGNDLSVFSPLRYALGYEGDSFVVSLCSTIRLHSVALSVLDGGNFYIISLFFMALSAFFFCFFSIIHLFSLTLWATEKNIIITIKSKN